MLFMPTAWACETGLPLDIGIPGFWDSTVPVSGRTDEDTVYSSTARYRSEEPVSVSGCYTSTPSNTDRPEGPECGSKSRTDQSCTTEAWWTLGW